MLLPPLHLYRALLRAHRRLPPAERVLGDSYVKHEFKLHKDVTDGVILTKFFKEWTGYLSVLEGQNMAKIVGPQLLDKLTDEQIGQLYELMKAIKEEAAAPTSTGAEKK